MIPLETSKLFREVPAEQVRGLFDKIELRSFAAGQPIFKEGEIGDGVYVVRQGAVEISARIGEEAARALTRIEAGDFFGEMAVLDCEPRSATALAKVDSEVYFIPRKEMLLMLERAPGLTVNILRIFSQRMREFNRHYLREAVQAERLTLVGKFARSIVHDLKNPLNVIGLAAEVIDAPNSNEQARLYAKSRIHKYVARITNMVNELLEFTRGGKSPLALAEVNYAEFLAQLIEDLKLDLQADGVEFCFENELPAVTLQLDATRLTQVFANLVHNAVDAMPNGGRIILRFSRDADYLTTEVEDTGPGISPEIVAKLFEPFATFGKTKGTGLGLSICKRIIEDHAGEIRVRSEPGRGAVFAIRLPLRR